MRLSIRPLAGAIPLFVGSLVDLSPLCRRLMGFLSRFCALSCDLGAARVLFGSLLLPLKGERFPMPGALLRRRFTALCALLCRLCPLYGFGLPFRFLLQCMLACSFAGGGCGANARDGLEVLAAFNLFAGGAGAVQGCGLGAVVVVAAEIDFSPVGGGGVSSGVPAGLPGSRPPTSPTR
jgi:hypothetical protein